MDIAVLLNIGEKTQPVSSLELHAVNARVPSSRFRVFGDLDTVGDERAAVLEAICGNGQAVQVDRLPFQNDFLTWRFLYENRSDGTIGRLLESLDDFFFPEAEGAQDPAPGGVESADHGYVVAFDLLEEDRRTLLVRGLPDVGRNLVESIHGLGNPDQVPLFLQTGQEIPRISK